MDKSRQEIKSDNYEMNSNNKEYISPLEDTNKYLELIIECIQGMNNSLDNTIKIKNEREILLIRLIRLENEIAQIKTRLKELA